ALTISSRRIGRISSERSTASIRSMDSALNCPRFREEPRNDPAFRVICTVATRAPPAQLRPAADQASGAPRPPGGSAQAPALQFALRSLPAQAPVPLESVAAARLGRLRRPLPRI